LFEASWFRSAEAAGHPAAPRKVNLMAGERIVFTEESNPQNYLKLVASGEVDETMLEALEDYVKRQKKAACTTGWLQDRPRGKMKRPPTEAASIVI